MRLLRPYYVDTTDVIATVVVATGIVATLHGRSALHHWHIHMHRFATDHPAAEEAAAERIVAASERAGVRLAERAAHRVRAAGDGRAAGDDGAGEIVARILRLRRRAEEQGQGDDGEDQVTFHRVLLVSIEIESDASEEFINE